MRRYLIFITVSLPLLLFSISGTSVAVAFPNIITGLNTSLVIAGWIMIAFQLATIVLLPVTGEIINFFGKRFTLLLSMVVFTVGSALCAIAPNIHMLIAFRIIQAVGGVPIMPCVTSIVSDTFPETRQRAIGLLSSIFPIGMIIGPNLGGWLVESFGWRSIFWLNIPIGIVILVFSRLLLTGDQKIHSGKIDFVGVGLLSSSLIALMLGMTELANLQSLLSCMLSGLLIVSGIIFMIIFLRWEQKTANPIIDLAILKEKPFLATNIYNLMFGACVLGVVTLIPLYAVSVYGMSTFESGFILTPRSIAMVIMSAIASFVLMRWGYRRPILLGTITTALSLFLLALEPQEIEVLGFHPNAYVLLGIIMFISGFGFGVAAPASNNACIELMPDKVATITALRMMFRMIGGAFGIALSTVVIHVVGDVGYAFQILFFGWTVILLLSLIAVFAMPSHPNSILALHTNQKPER